MSLKSKAKATAKRAGLLTGGLFILAIGVAFLTGAAWIYLATVADVLTAALVIGATYVGLGLVLVGLSSSSGPVHPNDTQHPQHLAAQPERDPAQPPLMQAFLYGMQAGTTASTQRR